MGTMEVVRTSADRPTAYQIQVLTLAAQGLSREQIGRELFISPWTVKTHLDNLREMIGAKNVTHALAICVCAGDVQIDPVTHQITSPELELRAAAA